MNYLLTLMFDGANYHGWQRQDNAVTVQQKVEEAVFSLLGAAVSVTGCSRTDAGVHAHSFFANFKCDKAMALPTVVSGLNYYLPEDICVTSCRTVPDDFNARFSCISKEYHYIIYDSRIRNPFYKNRAAHCKHPLDAALMNEQAKDFIGTFDFTSFCAAGASVRSNVRTVLDAGVYRAQDQVVFYVEANGFLYNMVRIMAGTLLYIAENKIQAGSIPQVIEAKNRLMAGKTMPPEGLYLYKVHYKEI